MASVNTRFPFARLITAMVKRYAPPAVLRPKVTVAEAVRRIRAYVEEPWGALAAGDFETWQEAAICLFHDAPSFDDGFKILHDLRVVKGDEQAFEWTSFGLRVLGNIEKSNE